MQLIVKVLSKEYFPFIGKSRSKDGFGVKPNCLYEDGGPKRVVHYELLRSDFGLCISSFDTDFTTQDCE